MTRNIRSILAEKPWRSWLRRKPESHPSPVKDLVENQSDLTIDNALLELGSNRVRIWLKGTLGNPVLLIGLLVTFALAGVMLFSPLLSPHSPYTTQGMTFVDGEFLIPPFEPDQTYPWGTDSSGSRYYEFDLRAPSRPLPGIFCGRCSAPNRFFTRGTVGWVLAAGWTGPCWALLRFIAAFPALLRVMV